MFSPLSRRRFVTGTAAGALTALGNFDFLGALPAAEERKDKPTVAQVAADVEPLVRLIEETPRDKLLEAVATKVRAGTSYQQLLSAVMLAGVRGIKPRPVGFQFHAVLVINSAHLASLAAADQDRWLPLFWAMDNFKSSQATQRQAERRLDDAGPRRSRRCRPPTRPASVLPRRWTTGTWRPPTVAVAALARTAGAAEVFEMFWRYGAATSATSATRRSTSPTVWRTLQTIGWRHAEPVLRSLAFALLEHGRRQPGHERRSTADRPGRENLKRAADIGPPGGAAQTLCRGDGRPASDPAHGPRGRRRGQGGRAAQKRRPSRQRLGRDLPRGRRVARCASPASWASTA